MREKEVIYANQALERRNYTRALFCPARHPLDYVPTESGLYLVFRAPLCTSSGVAVRPRVTLGWVRYPPYIPADPRCLCGDVDCAYQDTSFPHRIVLAFAIVLIPLGSEISDYVPFGFCAMGTVPRCLFLTRWLQQAVLDWYGHGPLVLSLIMLVVYGLVLRVGVWVSRTDTAASTYVPTVDTDA